MGALIWDGAAIWRDGFFQDYNNLVLLTIAVQALGGLIIAMVMKYADSILKRFATSAAIVVSVVASVILFYFFGNEVVHVWSRTGGSGNIFVWTSGCVSEAYGGCVAERRGA